MKSLRVLRVSQVMEIVDVPEKTVLQWIDSGELPASNVAAAAHGQRPRWRILESDLESFLAARRKEPRSKPIKHRRLPTSIPEHFK